MYATGDSKPSATWKQPDSDLSTVNPLIASYDIHERKGLVSRALRETKARSSPQAKQAYYGYVFNIGK
jgi:hypothetical protein